MTRPWRVACLAAAGLLLAPARAPAPTVTGDLRDIFGQPLDIRVTFRPELTPLADGQQTILDVPRSIRSTNGVFAAELVGGYYTVDFGPYGRPMRIAVPQSPGTYTLHYAASLRTNLTVWALPVTSVAAGWGLHATTNQTLVTLSVDPAVITGTGMSHWPGTIEVINVKDHGVKGDGITDDWPALNQILSMTNPAYAPIGAYRMVYFPAGTYLVSTNLIWPYGTRLVGDGAATDHAPGNPRRGTLIRPHPNWTGTALIDSMSWHRGEWHHYATIEHMGLVGTRPGESVPVVQYGVRVQRAGELCALHNVKIHRFERAGVWGAGTHAELILDRVSIHNCGWYAVMLTPGSRWDLPYGTGDTWHAAGTVLVDKLSSDLCGIATIGLNGVFFLSVRDAKVEQISAAHVWPHRAGTNIIHVSGGPLDTAPAGSGKPVIYWSGGQVEHHPNHGQSDYRDGHFLYSDSGGLQVRFLLEGARVYAHPTNYWWVRTPDVAIQRAGTANQEDAPTVTLGITNYAPALVGGVFSGNAAGLTNLPVAGIAATGTPDSTTFLRGDGAWAVPAGGGGGSTEYIAAGTGIIVATNGSLYTISTPAITNLESRLVYITNYAGTRTNLWSVTGTVPPQSVGWYRVAETVSSVGAHAYGRFSIEATSQAIRHSAGLIEAFASWSNSGHSPELRTFVSHFGMDGGSWIAARIIVAPANNGRAFLDLLFTNVNSSDMVVAVDLVESLFRGWRVFTPTNVPDDGLYVPYANPIVITQSLFRVGYGIANRYGSYWHQLNDGALWASRLSSPNASLAGRLDFWRMPSLSSRTTPEQAVMTGTTNLAIESTWTASALGFIGTAHANLLLNAHRRMSVTITNTSGTITPTDILFDHTPGTTQTYPLSQLPLYIEITNTASFGVVEYLSFHIPAHRGTWGTGGFVTWTLRYRQTDGTWVTSVARSNVYDPLPITVPLLMGAGGVGVNGIELVIYEAVGPSWSSANVAIPDIVLFSTAGAHDLGTALGALSRRGGTVYGPVTVWSNMVVQTGGQYIGNAAGLTNLPVAGIAATGTPDNTTFLRGDGAWAVPAGGGGGSTEYIEAGPGILVATNGSLYTISTPAITNQDTRTVTLGNLIVRNTIAGVDAWSIDWDGVASFALVEAPHITGGTFSGNAAGLTNLPVTGIAATGTRDNTTFLRGDGTWATPPSGGGGIVQTNLIEDQQYPVVAIPYDNDYLGLSPDRPAIIYVGGPAKPGYTYTLSGTRQVSGDRIVLMLAIPSEPGPIILPTVFSGKAVVERMVERGIPSDLVVSEWVYDATSAHPHWSLVGAYYGNHWTSVTVTNRPTQGFGFLPVSVSDHVAGWLPSVLAEYRSWGHSMWWHVPNAGTAPAASPGAAFALDGGAAVVRTNTVGDVSPACLVAWTNGSDSSVRLRYAGNLAPRRDGWGGYMAVIGLNHTNDVRIGIGVAPSGSNHMPAPGGTYVGRLFCLALLNGQWHWLSHPGSGSVSYEPLGIHASTNNGGNYQVAILRRPGTSTFDVWLNGRHVHTSEDFNAVFATTDSVAGNVVYTPTAADVNAGIRLYRTEVLEYATGFESW